MTPGSGMERQKACNRGAVQSSGKKSGYSPPCLGPEGRGDFKRLMGAVPVMFKRGNWPNMVWGKKADRKINKF